MFYRKYLTEFFIQFALSRVDNKTSEDFMLHKDMMQGIDGAASVDSNATDGASISIKNKNLSSKIFNLFLNSYTFATKFIQIFI